jgi:hypothetical protein
MDLRNVDDTSARIPLFAVHTFVYDSLGAHTLAFITPPIRRSPKVTLSTRIDAELREVLDDYCQFAQCGREHVVAESLRRTFEQDDEFRQWKEQRLLHENAMAKGAQ